MTTLTPASLQVIFKVREADDQEAADYCREPSPSMDMGKTEAWAARWVRTLEQRHPGSIFSYIVEIWY